MLDAARATEALSWGIVGFGWVARDHAAPGLLAGGGRIAAVADPSPESRRAARRLGARAHADLAPLLEDPEVEAIYVATPNHLHRTAVEACARAGKPVLCEKPMAATLPDAEAMAASVARAGIPAGTAFDQRHHPAHALLREEIAAGRVGEVTAIRIVYACWVDAGWSADNWRADPARAGGGALMDLAPHGLDLVHHLLGEEVVELRAMMQRRVHAYAVEDGALLIGRTTSGVLVQMHVAYNCPEALPRRRLEVVGTRGMLSADRTMGQGAGGTVAFTDARLGLTRVLPVPDAAQSPFERQMRAFARHLHGAPDPAFDMARDLRLMRLLDRAMKEDGSCR